LHVLYFNIIADVIASLWRLVAAAD